MIGHLKVGVVLLIAIVVMNTACSGTIGRRIAKIQDDGEDFLAMPDEDNDGLSVANFKLRGRSIAISGSHTLCNPLNQAVFVADWSDGTVSETKARANGSWTITHTYPADGEFAIEIRCYCKQRLVGRDSDILLIRDAPGGAGGGSGSGG